ncbi:MAG: hypothetical protein PHN90_00045 [Methanothrix sp.]|nr:hypothetical protein [Methanothrix sp.]MDI9399198.1 hypothetical protein [Euryarchaeota archaeon]
MINMKLYFSAGVIILCLLLVTLTPASGQDEDDYEGPPPNGDGDAGSRDSSGGKSKLSLNQFVRYLESWQRDNSDKYRYMTQLLRQGNPESYKVPYIWLYYNGNLTVSRNEIPKIYFVVENPNSLDLRRTLFVDLQAKLPGEREYHNVNQIPQVVQPFDYVVSGERNITSLKKWPEINSFTQIGGVGEVKLRAYMHDGTRDYYSSGRSNTTHPHYGEMTINITNAPPQLFNATLVGPQSPRYNDPLEYVAEVFDPDDDLMAVRLHITDPAGREVRNETQEAKSGRVSFKAAQYGFFGEADAGKNFTYYYSLDDGIDITSFPPRDNPNATFEGPNIRSTPKLWVENLHVEPVDKNYYYWDEYNFSVVMRNQEPYSIEIPVTLKIKTKDKNWKGVETRTVTVTPDSKRIYFSTDDAFDVLDRGSDFSFRFEYQEYDQNNERSAEMQWYEPLNQRLMKYDLVSIPIGINLLFVLILPLLGGIFLEKWMGKGRLG